MRDTPFVDHRSRFIAGRFGMRLFLVSLAVLFAASLVGFAVIRVQLMQKSLWPVDLPPLPHLLWVSTIVLAISSVSMQSALVGIRRDRQDRLRSGMLATLLLGLTFLLVQMRCWLTWTAPVSQRWAESEEYRFALAGFYVLTGLHALHVVGGIVLLTFVARRAFSGLHSSKHHSGVHYAAMYWHFLGAVWIVLLLSLLIGM